MQAAALAMDHLQVDLKVALRVLAAVSTRRGAVTTVVAVLEHRQRRLHLLPNKLSALPVES